MSLSCNLLAEKDEYMCNDESKAIQPHIKYYSGVGMYRDVRCMTLTLACAC